MVYFNYLDRHFSGCQGKTYFQFIRVTSVEIQQAVLGTELGNNEERVLETVEKSFFVKLGVDRGLKHFSPHEDHTMEKKNNKIKNLQNFSRFSFSTDRKIKCYVGYCENNFDEYEIHT